MEKYQIINFYNRVLGKINHSIFKGSSSFLTNKRMKNISRVLDHDYRQYIESFNYNETHDDDRIIWTMWLQGEEEAPYVVKKCIESMRNNLPDNYSLVVLDKGNLSTYISFPDFIIEKLKSGVITKTHFSDLVRAKLLATYGGIWMDSTVFVSKKLNDKELNRYPFYSSREESAVKSGNIANYRWCAFVLGGTNRRIFGLLDFLFEQYWKEHSYMIDYFLVDYFLNLIYMKDESSRESIDLLPVNYNGDILRLQDSNLTDEQINEILDGNTYLYKMSYKNQISENRIKEVIGEGK